MTDSGWKDGQRNVGASYILDADAADIDAAKRAAEDALRRFCRDVLAALEGA